MKQKEPASVQMIKKGGNRQTPHEQTPHLSHIQALDEADPFTEAAEPVLSRQIYFKNGRVKT